MPGTSEGSLGGGAAVADIATNGVAKIESGMPAMTSAVEVPGVATPVEVAATAADKAAESTPHAGIEDLAKSDPLLARAINPAEGQNLTAPDLTKEEQKAMREERTHLGPDAVQISKTKSEMRSPDLQNRQFSDEELQTAQNQTDEISNPSTSESNDPNGTTPFPEVDQGKAQTAPDQSEKSSTATESITPTPGSEQERVALGFDTSIEGGKANNNDSGTDDEQEAKRQQELQSYEAKIADKSITSEEYEKYQKLREPDRRMQELDKKVKDGTATVEELNEWKNGPEPENTDTRSPEEIQKQNEQELEDVGTEFFESFTKGDEAKIAELSEVFNEKLAAQQNLNVSEAGKKELRDFIHKLMRPETARSKGESAKMQALKEKLLELSRLELQIRSLEVQAKELNKRIKESQDDAARAENDYYNQDENNHAEKQRKLLIFQGSAMRVQSLIDAKDDLQPRWLKNDIQRRVVLGDIHRKIGSKGLIRNILWGAKTAGAQVIYGGVQTVKFNTDRFA